MKWFKYILAFTLPGVIYFSINSSGIYTSFAIIYGFVLIPLVELIIQPNPKNLEKAEAAIMRSDKMFDLLLYAFIPIQYFLLFTFLNRIAFTDFTAFEGIFIVLSYGLGCGAFGINVAHELGHRNSRLDKILAKSLLLTSLYMHWYIEHNRGHHKNVSTDEDPASAKRDEVIYIFFFRSIINSFISAWRLEKKRLQKSNKSTYSFHNEMLIFMGLELALIGVIYIYFGSFTLILFIIAALVGILLLEMINYIEHYGLRREKIEEERYEKVLPIHSWNSDHPIGRMMLFELTRHSDHHYQAGKKYQLLRSLPLSPQLPTGYPGSMILTLIPPLWFHIMNKRIDKIMQQKEEYLQDPAT